VGATNVVVDLALTLPSGVARGGVFSLAPSSQPLPFGVLLASNGLLTVSNPAAGLTEGVVFSYSEP
jgi:hypothetical protein